MAIQFVPLIWATLGRGVAFVGKATVRQAVKKGAQRVSAGTIPPRLAAISGRAFTAGDLVYTGVALTDYFTEEELVRSEVGRSVMDIYGAIMLARFGGASARFVKQNGSRVAAASASMRGVLQRKYPNAKSWVGQLPRLQGSLSHFGRMSVAGATRTWTKVYDKSAKAWIVLDKKGRPMLKMTREGFEYLRTDRVALRNVALAGGTAFGASLMFDIATFDESSDATSDEVLNDAMGRGRQSATAIVGEYLDYVANSLYPDEDDYDYGNDGEPADFIRRLLTYPSSAYNRLAVELGESPTSNTTEEVMLVKLVDAVRSLLIPDDSADELDPHIFITDNVSTLYEELVPVDEHDAENADALPEDMENVRARTSISASNGTRGSELFADA